MDGEGTETKGPIDLDWKKLFDVVDEVEDEPPELVVVQNSERSSVGAMEAEEQNLSDLRSMSDKKLLEAWERLKNNSLIMQRLKDGGEKYKLSIQRHEAELWRRRIHPDQKNVDDGCWKPLELQNNNCTGLSDDVLHQASSPPSSVPSTFASCLNKKLEEKTGSATENAFDKELSTLNRCDNLDKPANKQFIPSGRKNRRIALRASPFRSPGGSSLDVDGKPLSSGYQKDRTISPPLVSKDDVPSLFGSRKAACRTSNRLKRTKGETVVVVDEEELEVEETTLEDNEAQECKSTGIYYPSRDDPGSIEIHYSDMDCLAPEAYLSSTIMNFYIRYLQEQRQTMKTAVEERLNYHFFNTYFYEKLKEAVAKKNISENSFAKFRRWWKGVNIFEKAYIFLPIHENLHWSLVIICIPDKEDRSGPILLHLDSLGFHSSGSIFSNIKSFLKEEWKFLKEREMPLDLPIADTIWENLPRRIDEKTIEVPQQSNDYDCGLFVLFFMKRFIEEAPQRLKKKDLAMFGRHWFNPAEASSLRKAIRILLKEKFKSVSEENKVLDR